jgi:kinesin family protein 11
VNNFQVDLAQKVGSLGNLVAASMFEQKEHLQCVEKLCHSFTGIHDKVLNDTCIIVIIN